MVTTESPIDSQVPGWLPLVLLNSSKSFSWYLVPERLTGSPANQANRSAAMVAVILL